MNRGSGIFILLLSGVTIFGCQSSGDQSSDRPNQEMVASRDTLYSLPSNKYFYHAKEAYRQGDLSKAARQIEEGGKAWAKELPQNDTLKLFRKEMVKRINQLAAQTRAGESLSMDYLNTIFSEAEILGARMEMKNSIQYLKSQQTDSAISLGNQAIARVNEALTYTEKTLNKESRHMINGAQSVLDKIEEGAKPDVESLSLKLDSIQIALHDMVEPRDMVQDIDTAYVSPN